MKRWLIAAGLLVLLIAALVAALPLLVSTEIAKDRIAAVLSDWLGAEVVVEGEPHVSFASGLSVVLPDVRARDTGQDLTARFQSVEAEVNWLPLLQGQVELSRFLLRNPEIVADAGSSVFAIDALRRDPADWPFATDDLRIEGGSFTILRPDGARETISDIHGTLAWPGARGEAALSASFTWHGEPVELRAGLSDTAVFSGAAKGTLNLSLTSTPLRVNFEGVLLGPSDLQANGTASIAVPNLRRLLAWTGRDPGEGATLGPFSLDGEAKANADGIQLNGATLELDGNVGTGLLAFDWRGSRPSLQGTLDFEKLDLSGYFSEWLHLETWDETAGFSKPIAEAAAADIDVQLSARQVRIGAARIGRTAASLLIKQGNLALDISEAILYGGSIAARFAATVAPDAAAGAETVAVSGDVRAHDIDLGALPLDTWKIRPVSGVLGGTFNASASGASLGDLAASAAGRLETALTGFTLDGFDLGSAIDTFAAGTGGSQGTANGGGIDPGAPGDGSGTTPQPTAQGRTTFDTVTVNATIADGIATFTDVAALSAELAVTAEGRASLAEGSIGLTGLATHTLATPPTTLPFLVRGPLTTPQFLPDVNRLIEEKKVQ